MAEFSWPSPLLALRHEDGTVEAFDLDIISLDEDSLQNEFSFSSWLPQSAAPPVWPLCQNNTQPQLRLSFRTAEWDGRNEVEVAQLTENSTLPHERVLASASTDRKPSPTSDYYSLSITKSERGLSSASAEPMPSPTCVFSALIESERGLSPAGIAPAPLPTSSDDEPEGEEEEAVPASSSTRQSKRVRGHERAARGSSSRRETNTMAWTREEDSAIEEGVCTVGRRWASSSLAV